MPRGRPSGTIILSDWELDELLHYRRRGWSLGELANYYGLSERTVSRYIKRARRDSGPAMRDVD